MNRRGFLQAVLASSIAPYVITTAGVLMPTRQRIIAPALDLSEANLEKMLIELHSLVDDRGLRINILPSKVWYNPTTINPQAMHDFYKKVIAEKRPALCGLGYTSDAIWRDE